MPRLALELAQTHTQWQLGSLFLDVMWPLHEVEHSAPAPAQVESKWCFTSIPPQHLNDMDRDNITFNNIIRVIESIVPSRNIGCLWVLSTSVQLLGTLVHSSFYPLPWGFQSRAAFGTFPSSFLNVWPIHLNFLFLISKFISSCPVTFHRSLLEIIFGHHILSIYLRHQFTKVSILRWISFVTSQVTTTFDRLKIIYFFFCIINLKHDAIALTRTLSSPNHVVL